MITENLSTLQIHKLTQAQYDRELAANSLNPNALYLTTDTTIPVDTTLALEGSAADAKATGDALSIINNTFSKLDKTNANVGNWTPVVSSGADSVTEAEGLYIKVGNMCVLQFWVTGVASTTEAQLKITGIPFPVSDKVSEVCGGGLLTGYKALSDDGKEKITFSSWCLKNSGNIYAYVNDDTSNYARLVSADANNPTAYHNLVGPLCGFVTASRKNT